MVCLHQQQLIIDPKQVSQPTPLLYPPQRQSPSLAQITNTFHGSALQTALIFRWETRGGTVAKTVSDTVSLIRIILKFARRQGLHLRCDGSDIHIKQKPKPMRVLSQQEQERLCRYLYAELDGCHLRDLAMPLHRITRRESVRMRWENLLSRAALHVNRTLQRSDTCRMGARTMARHPTRKPLLHPDHPIP